MEGIYNVPGSEPITHLAVWYYSPGLVEDVVIGIKKGKEDQWDCSKDSRINAQHTRVSSRSYSIEQCYKFRCFINRKHGTKSAVMCDGDLLSF